MCDAVDAATWTLVGFLLGGLFMLAHDAVAALLWRL